jgi:hypothetical protein
MRGPMGRRVSAPVTRLIVTAAAVALSVLAFAASPAMASDGTGTMTVAPSYVISGSSANYLTFTYTAGSGGISGGTIALTVPTGWTTPSTGFSAGGVGGTCLQDSDQFASVAGGTQIQMQDVFLSANTQCTIEYGISGFNSGDTAPSTAQTYTFTAAESTTSSGTLTNLTSGSAQVVVGNDGTGTMTVSTPHAVASSTGNTLTFTYTATRQMTSGELTIAVPSGWSTPSTTGSAPGDTTSNCGTVGVSSSTIQVTGVTLASGGSCTVTYGNKTSGPGVTPPATGGPTPATFTVQQEATNDNNLNAIGSSPKVVVTGADGSGTMTVSPTNVIQSSTGNQMLFTYTAPAGGLSNGNLYIAVPSGWSAPSFSNPAAAGFVSDQCGAETDTVSGMTIELQGLSLTSGESCSIYYGYKWEGPGATAPPSEGPSTFTTQEQSYSTGTLTTLTAGSPVVAVGSDGTGTMSLATQHVYANSTGNTLTFTYTAGVTISNGELTVAIPSGGWSTPSTTPSAAGATTSTCGAVGVSGSTIQVTGVSLTAGGSCTVVYGNQTSGPGATGPTGGGPVPIAFTTQEKSSSTGTLTTLGSASPSVIVTAIDGSGTMAVSPTNAITSSTGNTLTFTYTAPAGGLDNGNVNIVVPSGWSAPSFSNPAAGGFTSDECGANTDATSGQAIELQGLSMTGGTSCEIIYGNKFEGPGASAPGTAGASTFTTQEQSYSTGTLTTLTAGSPLVNVGNDGLGTMTLSPAIATSGTSGNQLTLSYKAASTVSSGELTIAVPAGWSTPSTTASAAGATTSTCGTVAVSGSTIQVTGVSLAANGTCAVIYGDKTSGPGATAPVSGGPASPYTFTTQEKSSSSGTLTTLGTGSPSVVVVAADATGTMTVSPTNALNGSGQEYTFTYTAAAGGLDNGELTIQVPSGWTAPQTSTPSGAGYVIDECGQTIAIAGNTIQSSGVSLSGGGTCQIIYGLTGSGGAGGVAPATSGPYTFASQEKSTSGGALGAITSPVVNVDNDGVGTLTVVPLVLSAGTTGSTLTFTYSAPGGVALSGGEVTVAIPAGWPAPSTTTSAAGFTSTTCSGASVHAGSGTIDLTGINLAASSNCTIVYGSRGSGGPGLTVPSSTGGVQFSAQERSSSSGSLTALGSPAQLTVYAPDGSSTMTASPAFTIPGSDGNTLTFTYTAAQGGLTNGELTLAVPSGWSTPSTSGGVDGYTSSTCGNVAINGGIVEVTSVSLASGGACKIVYGDTSRGGAGATAPSSAGTSTFTTEESSTASGTLTSLATSPQVALLSADGAGTLTATPGTLVSGSSGNTLTFIYTAASGGTGGGEITLTVPSGFSAPSAIGGAPGFTSSNCGTVAVAGTTIQITGVTVAGGSTCTISYGSLASGGPGATVPSSVGTFTFASEQSSTGSGTLTEIERIPSVTTVTAPIVPVTLSPLTVTVNGSGTVTGGGLSCPGTCSMSFAPGTTVALTATPASGFELGSWGGACGGTGACSATMNAATAVTATFVKQSSPATARCVVPKLKGDSLAKAKTLLAKAHCSVGRVKAPKVPAGHRAPKVVVGSTSPRAGSRLANHAKVGISLVVAPRKK